jgi:phytoene dehydrogenase-like protein
VNGRNEYDAVIVGSGPNGLSAGIVLAQKGLKVKIFEAKDTIGGGMRSAELTLPGFIHDICSAIHPLGADSPFLKTLPLKNFGLEWIYPGYSLAHPFDDGTSLNIQTSLKATAESFGRDGEAYMRLMKPFVKKWNELAYEILGPLRFPKHPFLMMRFGLKALRSAKGLAESIFDNITTRALFMGMAAHSMLPVDAITTASIGAVLGILGHTKGWPVAKGGTGKIAEAMGSYFLSLGGEIETGCEIKSLNELPGARAVLLDITPRQILKIEDGNLSEAYKGKLKKFRYGGGVFKIDWALNEQIPFKSPPARMACTVHLGGMPHEIEESEYLVNNGTVSETPYVILAQQSIADKSRAPEGKHTGWAYCHVPAGWEVDMTERIENQVERFAPGFKEIIAGRHVTSPADFEKYNANYIGGDINGGMQDIWQLYTRPVVKLNPYKTSSGKIFICSSSTPPGGGVHGMCGYYAARSALKDVFGIKIDLKI